MTESSAKVKVLRRPCPFCEQPVEVHEKDPEKGGFVWINPSDIADQVPHRLTCKKWPRRPGTCKYCEAEIVWLQTEEGKWLPLQGNLHHSYFCGKHKRGSLKKAKKKPKPKHKTLDQFVKGD